MSRPSDRDFFVRIRILKTSLALKQVLNAIFYVFTFNAQNHGERTFRLILKYLRKQTGLKSRYALAKNSGIPYSTIRDICTYKTALPKCSTETVYKITEALDVSMEELVKQFSDAQKEKPRRDCRRKIWPYHKQFRPVRYM